MLLNFQVANWACFRDPMNFTMEAGPERDAGGHLVKIGAKSRPLKVLPVAAVYGNNASGKSQFIAALSFLRSLVIEEFKTGRLPLAPFLLDDTLAKEPTHFVIQFVVGDSVYELDVLLTDSEIRRETLSRYNSRNTDKTAIYVREGQKVVSCTWGGDAYCQYVKTMNVDPTRLFLTLSAIFAAGKDELIASVYNWFSRSLVIITPGSHYIGVDDYCTEGRIADRTLDYLARFDTGISRLDAEVVPLSAFHPSLLDEVRKLLTPGASHRRLLGNEVFVFSLDEKGELVARRLVALHAKAAGGEMPFPISLESEGTRRMLDFIPALARLTEPNQSMTFVVDEIDNKLHHLVTRALVEDFIATCTADTRTQLIFTTHDLLLMAQDLCRRDEMWVTDKAPDGSATLADFASFEGLRKGTKIRDIYLDGRLGGIPRHIGELGAVIKEVTYANA